MRMSPPANLAFDSRRTDAAVHSVMDTKLLRGCRRRVVCGAPSCLREQLAR